MIYRTAESLTGQGKTQSITKGTTQRRRANSVSTFSGGGRIPLLDVLTGPAQSTLSFSKHRKRIRYDYIRKRRASVPKRSRRRVRGHTMKDKGGPPLAKTYPTRTGTAAFATLNLSSTTDANSPAESQIIQSIGTR